MKRRSFLALLAALVVPCRKRPALEMGTIKNAAGKPHPEMWRFVGKPLVGQCSFVEYSDELGTVRYWDSVQDGATRVDKIEA